MLRGIGLTPEAIETNPIAYDLMMENTWRGTVGVTDLSAWVESYVGRRYSGIIPDSGTTLKLCCSHSPAFEAWGILQNTVYSCNTSQQGTSGSIFAVFPAFQIDEVSCCAPLAPYYNTSDVERAFGLLLSAAEEPGSTLSEQTTYQMDIVTLCSQVMSNRGIVLHSELVTQYLNNDTDGQRNALPPLLTLQHFSTQVLCF